MTETIQIADGWKKLTQLTGSDLEKAARKVNPGAFVRSDAFNDTLKNPGYDSAYMALGIMMAAGVDLQIINAFGQAVHGGMPVNVAIETSVSMLNSPDMVILGVMNVIAGGMFLLGKKIFNGRYRVNLSKRLETLKKTALQV